MEKEKITVQQKEPTDWVNSMVTLLKPYGRVHTCMDKNT